MPSKSNTESPTASYSRFPEQVRPILLLIEKNALNDVGAALIQYVASFVNPDCVCNLAIMNMLSDEAKAATTEMFNYCLTVGLTLDEQGDLLRFIEPFVNATMPGQPRH